MKEENKMRKNEKKSALSIFVFLAVIFSAGCVKQAIKNFDALHSIKTVAVLPIIDNAITEEEIKKLIKGSEITPEEIKERKNEISKRLRNLCL